MAGTGPAPNPNARRRNARVGVVVLPADGYQGEIPEWPLLPDVVVTAKRDIALRAAEAARCDVDDEDLSRAERAKAKRALEKAEMTATVLDAQLNAQVLVEVELWNQLWRTPQAEQWARLGWVREVAQYARHKAAGELGSLDDAKEARMLSDRLGLSPKAMRGLMWVVGDAPSEAGTGTTTTSSKGGKAKTTRASRRHLAAVDTAAGA